uniref:HTH_Tnp_Tc3_1 domain-containing protein n=1 Tax=Caenorhabditis japonica TaxID=281687 RepID=A0A8R1I8Y8_CAEJA
MHQLGSSLHMISRYVKKSGSALRSYLNNPLYYGKKKSTGRPRNVTSRDERNIILSVSTTTHAVHASKHIPRNDIKPLGWKQLEAGDLRGVPGTTISQVDTSHSFPLFAQFTFYRSTVYPFQLLPLTNIIGSSESGSALLKGPRRSTAIGRK